ncbi:GNAT family N-acetyltransferase [Danxiaibacter flavus]|uniref:GNAT family N-acetyltransferase n=1 Tax=Danxiaibacter flavus TaxID=3049108 RepID=A0ABV3ZII1_9BACT|nr:GNAT family N-acetyltransferase [Chitinophagaceae bacterium DXS]
MASLKPYGTPSSFRKAHGNLFSSNDLFFLKFTRVIDRIKSGEDEFRGACKIYDGGSFILCLLSSERCVLYSNSFHNGMVRKLADYLNRSKGLSMLIGSKNIVEAIAHWSKVEFLCDSNAVFYECVAISSTFSITTGQMKNACEIDINKLISMSAKFKEEFTNGEERYAHDTSNVLGPIENYYVWVVDNEVCAFVLFGKSDTKDPCIISIYTPLEFRNHGYASSLLYEVTKKILEKKYRKVVLWTKERNMQARKVFEKVGYSFVQESLDLKVVR